MSVWQNPLGTLLSFAAAGSHIALAFLALYEHRSLRSLPPLELLRIAFGFGIPTPFIGHAVGTRLAFELCGHPPDYAHVAWMLWRLRAFSAFLVQCRVAASDARGAGFSVDGERSLAAGASPTWVATTIVAVDHAQRIALVSVREADQMADRSARIGPIVISRAVCVTAQRDMQSLVWRELELLGGRRIEMAWLDPASAGLT